MKRHGDLWGEVVSFSNLLRAYCQARRGKSLRPDVERFTFRYRVWPGHCQLTSDSVHRVRRRLRRYQRWYALGRLAPADLTQRIQAWIGHAVHASSARYRGALLHDILFCRSPAD